MADHRNGEFMAPVRLTSRRDLLSKAAKLAIAAPAVLALGNVQSVAAATVVTRTVRLRGTAERPKGSGDLDARGTITLTLNVQAGQICYQLGEFTKLNGGVDSIFGIHIHGGKNFTMTPVTLYEEGEDNPGGPVLRSRCESVDPALIQTLLNRPQDYMVNIHTKAYPQGAAAGNL